MRWPPRSWDGEFWAGLAALVLVLATVTLTAAMIPWNPGSTTTRVVLPMVVVALTVSLVSSQWTRRVLRAVTLLCTGLIFLIIVDVGRTHLADESTLADGELDAEHTVTVLDALIAGAETTVADLAVQDDALPLALERALWVILAVIVLAWWRQVERRSGAQLPGPVTIEFNGCAMPKVGPAEPVDGAKAAEPTTPPDEPANAEKDTQKAEFRAAVLTNLSEPGPVPGGQTSFPVTDLVELVSSTAGWVQPLVNALKSALNPTVGYNVIADVLGPAKSTGRTDWQVLVRVSSRATGEQVDVGLVAGDTATLACRAAGYRAAAAILDRSTRVATWARWSQDSAESWARFDNPEDVGLPELMRAVTGAPSSGLMLQRLAAKLDLDGRHREALGIYARAVAAHPRYPAARYRLVVSLSLLMHLTDQQWISAPLSDRIRVTRQLQRACISIDADIDGTNLSELPGAGPAEAHRTLRLLHQRLATQLVADASAGHVLTNTLRRSERAVWWEIAKSIGNPWGACARQRWMARSARMASRDAGRERTNEIRATAERARDRRSWWQLSFNLACHHARDGNPDEALTWLETSLERPGCEALNKQWLESDPDLKSLHGVPRFAWLVDSVAQSKQQSGR